MKITEAQRLALRTRLVDVIGEPDTDVLMASIPPLDYELLATKDDLAALERITTAEFRSVRSEIQALRSETAGQFAAVQGQFAVVHGEFAAVRGEMVAMEGRFQLALAKQLRVVLAAQFASVVATVGLVVGLA